MTNKNSRLKAFLCHAQDDEVKTRELYRRLIADGFEAWLDKEHLLPGQDWDLEIDKAIRNTDVVIVCLSNKSTTKAGYVQKEIKLALDAADKQPEGTIFIIPVRLEECEVPDRLNKWQWVNLFEKNGYLSLKSSLKSRAKGLGKWSTPPLNVFEPEMIKIPRGEFLMGSSKAQAQKAIQDGAEKTWVQDEQPQHLVLLSEYYIAKHPVTNHEFQVFIRDTKTNSPLGWNGDEYPDGKDDHPAVNIPWEDATAFCEWLKQKTNRPYRLPTEAEWEKAARGTDGRIWPWGNEFDPEFANTREAKIMHVTRVGQFSPYGDSPYGCVDMIGNIWEWCSDWYDKNEYTKRTQEDTVTEDPNGPGNGLAHILRGGSFGTGRAGNRCADRIQFSKILFTGNYGFRVALSSIKLVSED
jgi:formylglycine-generating enzyme required for sulfatase activity